MECQRNCPRRPAGVRGEDEGVQILRRRKASHKRNVYGTPVYYIMYLHVYASSIGRIDADRHATYLTLDDGAVINTENFGKSAFWSKSEAEKALSLKGVDE